MLRARHARVAYLQAMLAILPLFGAWCAFGMTHAHAERREWSLAYLMLVVGAAAVSVAAGIAGLYLEL
jgi:hypothetical protein